MKTTSLNSIGPNQIFVGFLIAVSLIGAFHYVFDHSNDKWDAKDVSQDLGERESRAANSIKRAERKQYTNDFMYESFDQGVECKNKALEKVKKHDFGGSTYWIACASARFNEVENVVGMAMLDNMREKARARALEGSQ